MKRFEIRALCMLTAISLLTFTAFILPMPGFAESQTKEPVAVTMIADEIGLGDGAFNDLIYSGLMRAEKKLKISVSAVEPASEAAYSEMRGVAQSGSADLIVASGFTLAFATSLCANEFPDQKFAIVDSYVDLPNVANLNFKANEGSFLVGVIAGLTTTTDKIGFVGGMEIYLDPSFEYGFKAGVISVNPDAVVFVNFADSFTDPDAGYAAAMALIDLDADVIYHAAGLSGEGVIQAAADQGIWAIGVDVDQSSLNPDAVLCSMVKKVDNATYLVIKSVVDGSFCGDVVLGLAEDGVGYSDPVGNVPANVAAIANKYKKAIIDGNIVVPYDGSSYEIFLAQ